MDSWFDLILRLIIIGGIIGAIIFTVIKKNSEIKQPVLWHQYSDEEMLEAAEANYAPPEKPTGPPPPGSFQ